MLGRATSSGGWWLSILLGAGQLRRSRARKRIAANRPGTTSGSRAISAGGSALVDQLRAVNARHAVVSTLPAVTIAPIARRLRQGPPGVAVLPLLHPAADRPQPLQQARSDGHRRSSAPYRLSDRVSNEAIIGSWQSARQDGLDWCMLDRWRAARQPRRNATSSTTQRRCWTPSMSSACSASSGRIASTRVCQSCRAARVRRTPRTAPSVLRPGRGARGAHRRRACRRRRTGPDALRAGTHKLTPRQVERIQAAPQVGDPHNEATVAWRCYQRLQSAFIAESLAEGKRSPSRWSNRSPAARSLRSPARSDTARLEGAEPSVRRPVGLRLVAPVRPFSLRHHL
jgi:hypothetical protein